MIEHQGPFLSNSERDHSMALLGDPGKQPAQLCPEPFWLSAARWSASNYYFASQLRYSRFTDGNCYCVRRALSDLFCRIPEYGTFGRWVGASKLDSGAFWLELT